ncbi:hypothetical protein HYE82_06960 [Streptomyces sp. BR123]|uniref:hypothetical protein n=1 Tax=Streptomyces sp. BR123 TaxID=2749828 RepID=UPI0015C449E5|nr:hypothetical protein [Streptomyces sp. BR123]NXY94139.1 hypothetical protein [Streptomyces sp. BR123]
MARRQVLGPAPGTVTGSFEAGPHLVRGKDVKWLDSAGYARLTALCSTRVWLAQNYTVRTTVAFFAHGLKSRSWP